MRATLPGLVSPHPIALTLPGIYQGQSFLDRFCGALDEVLAPVLGTLDNLPAYLDVSTAPADLLPWLAYWIGMPVDPGQRSQVQREVLRNASRQRGWQGTARGVRLAVESVFGCRVEVQESGGATWSLDPGARLPGEPTVSVVVRVFPEPGRTVDERRLEMLVELLMPAHVTHRVELSEP
jgi:phage tail-like protein